MKAARLQAYGDVDQFRLEDVPDAVPGAGEVLIRIAAASLNPADLYVRQGFFAAHVPLDLPAIIGFDAAGMVAATGAGVSGFAAGDRVIAKLPLNGKGAYAELTPTPLACVARLPAGVTFEAGATLPLAGLTGRQCVDALGVKAGDRVLVSGALGSVGHAAVQYLKELGARPVAGVSATRLSEGEALASEAIDIGSVPAMPGFDFAVSLAAPVAANAVKHVRDGGQLASAVQVPEGANAGERIRIHNIMTREDPAMLQRIAHAAERGDLVIPVAVRFRRGEVAEAHKALAASPHGKIILTVS